MLDVQVQKNVILDSIETNRTTYEGFKALAKKHFHTLIGGAAVVMQVALGVSPSKVRAPEPEDRESWVKGEVAPPRMRAAPTGMSTSEVELEEGATESKKEVVDEVEEKERAEKASKSGSDGETAEDGDSNASIADDEQGEEEDGRKEEKATGGEEDE